MGVEDRERRQEEFRRLCEDALSELVEGKEDTDQEKTILTILRKGTEQELQGLIDKFGYNLQLTELVSVADSVISFEEVWNRLYARRWGQ
jgi:hypothetical protein